MRISIPAPARGATHTNFVFQLAIYHFNPRSREGSDIDYYLLDYLSPISIPAPARGATPETEDVAKGGAISIPAPARGATCLYRQCLGSNTRFQSPLPRGERRAVSCRMHQTLYISIPAPARGATFVLMMLAVGFVISIPAPARGATLASHDCAPEGRISIPAPARGATIGGRQNSYEMAISIPAPARGATSLIEFSQPRSIFQSPLPRGERLFAASLLSSNCNISIPAPARGATKLGRRGIGVELFQSPLPRGERPTVWLRHPEKSDFNPRSREGSDSENRQQTSCFRSEHEHNLQNISFCQSAHSLLQILMHGNTNISCANPARF